MAQILNVTEDGTVILDKVALKYTSGSVIHSGFLNITGNAQIDSNLIVQGNITAKVINVDSIVTANGSLAAAGQWTYNTDAELNGKGFSWNWGEDSTQLIYRTGGRLWTNASLDLASGSSLSIDNIPVITSSSLGSTIAYSNLTTVGTLNSLTVSGDTSLAEFFFVDSTSNRIGIGTDEPNSSLSIIDNNVEIGMGSPKLGLGTVGTFSSHDFAIVTDNLSRITVKNTGAVNIGDPVNGGGILNVYGTLYATSVETDNRIDRVHPLEFQATPTTSIYGLGLHWTGNGPSKQLVMMGAPDRLWSSESFDLGPNQGYHINGQLVVNSNSLGQGVVNSNLQTLGTLQKLTVSGDAFLNATKVSLLIVSDSNTDSQNYTVDNNSITGSKSVSIKVDTQPVLTSNSNQTIIGDVAVQTKPVKMFGPLSVNINNPDPTVQFSVNGDVNIGGKKFTNGTGAPTVGNFQIGDICWNTSPTPNGYVGWIYVSQGQWLGFGQIAAE